MGTIPMVAARLDQWPDEGENDRRPEWRNGRRSGLKILHNDFFHPTDNSPFNSFFYYLAQIWHSASLGKSRQISAIFGTEFVK